MKLEGTGRHLLKMRRERGKGNEKKGKEDKIVEKVGRMTGCNNAGRAGKTQNMCQVTFSQSITLMHVCSV